MGVILTRWMSIDKTKKQIGFFFSMAAFLQKSLKYQANVFCFIHSVFLTYLEFTSNFIDTDYFEGPKTFLQASEFAYYLLFRSQFLITVPC